MLFVNLSYQIQNKVLTYLILSYLILQCDIVTDYTSVLTEASYDVIPKA